MKQFKFTRVLASLLCISLALGSLLILPASAEDTPEDHLIVHYDFEGKTKEEQLKDKAGATEENLEAKGKNAWIISDGIVTFKANPNASKKDDSKGTVENKVGGNFLEADPTGHADFSEKNQFTIFVKYKTSGSYYDWTDIFNCTYLARVILTANNKLRLQNCDNKNLDTSNIPSINEWTTLAVTVDYSGSGDNGKYSVYMNGNCVQQDKELQIKNNKPNLATELKLRIGNALGEKNNALDVEIDDFRMYDSILTEDQIKSINVPQYAAATSSNDVVGYQVSSKLDANDQYMIRFIGQVDALTYEGAGLEITSEKLNRTWETQNTQTVYTGLLGKDGDGNVKQITAPEGSFFAAYTITGIPKDTVDTFTIKPFVIQNGQKVYGEMVTLYFMGYNTLAKNS